MNVTWTEWLIVLLVALSIPWLTGCCLDPDQQHPDNIITYEGGKVCSDSTQRGLSNAAKVCAPLCSKRSLQ